MRQRVGTTPDGTTVLTFMVDVLPNIIKIAVLELWSIDDLVKSP
jgi:hypothetical protein